MKFPGIIRVAVVVVLIVGLGWWWSGLRPPAGGPARQPVVSAPDSTRPKTVPTPGGTTPAQPVPPQSKLSAAEKQARVERIKRDYAEVREKAAAEFRAAGTNFPGGLHAFLRQLALLERELHNDLAAVLEPRELEDLEMQDTNAGQLVQRSLGDSAATDEQRRETFRLYRAFENEFALTFDLTPTALFARERERLATQEKIRDVLGDQLFGSWLRGQGPEFGQMTDFVARHGLPTDAALNLWRARNDLTLRQLELKATSNLTGEPLRQAQERLIREAEARVLAIIGAGALETARKEALGWLPRK